MYAQQELSETARLLNEITLKQARESHRRITTPTRLERLGDSMGSFVIPFCMGAICFSAGVVFTLAVLGKL